MSWRFLPEAFVGLYNHFQHAADPAHLCPQRMNFCTVRRLLGIGFFLPIPLNALVYRRANRLGGSVGNSAAYLIDCPSGSPPNLPHLLLLSHPESVAYIRSEVPDGFFHRIGSNRQHSFLHGPADS